MWLKAFKTLRLNFKPLKTLKNLRLWDQTLKNFLINTYFWWKFTLPTSYKYYVFLAVLDDLKCKIFFVRQPWWHTIAPPPPINFFISTGLRLTCNWQIRKFGDENSERKILKNSNCKMVKKPLKFFKHCGNRAKHVLLKCIIQDYFSLKAPSSNFYS